MIPKKIHYCWFGGNELSEDAKKCIDSWKKFCPDYEIIEWNEKNYDVTKNKYMKDAFEKKKWAFVSDYARIDVVYQNGGIYLDTDVEILRSLDNLLDNKFYCGWERNDSNENNELYINLGLGFGAQKESEILKKILELYENLSFIKEDGNLNLTPCPIYQTSVMKEFGLDTSNNNMQKNEYYIVYPDDYFSPKSYSTGKINITENTYSIHHFSMSWMDKKERIWRMREQKLSTKIGEKKAHLIISILSIPNRFKRKIKDVGIRNTFNRLKDKIINKE